MKHVLASAALLAVLVSFSSLYAADKPYGVGQIVDVEKNLATGFCTTW